MKERDIFISVFAAIFFGVILFFVLYNLLKADFTLSVLVGGILVFVGLVGGILEVSKLRKEKDIKVVIAIAIVNLFVGVLFFRSSNLLLLNLNYALSIIVLLAEILVLAGLFLILLNLYKRSKSDNATAQKREYY